MNVARGLDKKAMDYYFAKVEKTVPKEEPTTALRAMIAGADFMPMVPETVSYRYIFLPTVGLQDDPYARITVAHRLASQRREQGNVVLLSVWKIHRHTESRRPRTL